LQENHWLKSYLHARSKPPHAQGSRAAPPGSTTLYLSVKKSETHKVFSIKIEGKTYGEAPHRSLIRTAEKKHHIS
jgi:O-acetylhomoserine/O-acetylserine sulfhydrylase-like pyridoxal-dependent enzyme